MIELLQNNFPTLMQGFGYTLLSSVIALVGSLILGTVFAVMQVMPQTWVLALVTFMFKFSEIFHFW